MSGFGAIAVAAVGDVASPAAWSGIPYYFWQALRRASVDAEPIRLDLTALHWPRRRWALGRVLSGRRPAGYQYSEEFLDWAERQVPRELLGRHVISFNQHFPRAATVKRAGGRITYYIDATFVALSSGRGLPLQLPADVVEMARQLEIENYNLANQVVAMTCWTANMVIDDCGIDGNKVFTILAGANLDLPLSWSVAEREGSMGKDRPFVLGFLGKDWRRKGLMTVCDVRDCLAERGWYVMVRAAGHAPREVSRRAGIEFVGFIDKQRENDRFSNFLASCDVGCLFSSQEAFGISTLEFLRVGRPVAGYIHEGTAETIPTESGFRFSPSASVEEIADVFEDYLNDESSQTAVLRNARELSTQVTWKRCVSEWNQLLVENRIKDEFRLWRNDCADPNDLQ